MSILQKSALLAFLTFSSCAFSTTTIVSYNIANYNDHPDWQHRVDLLVDTIEKAKPDVIVLQEVRFDPDEPSSKLTYENSAEQLLQKLNVKGDFINAQLVTQPIMFYPMTDTTAHNFVLPAALSSNQRSYLWEGLSIISKRPILETGSVFLMNPTCTDPNNRASQFVKLVGDNGKPFYVVNTHFAYIDDCLENNIKQTLSLVKQWKRWIPIIIAGDMNAEPDNHALAAFPRDGFRDAWRYLNPKDPGLTYPSNAPEKRIDYIWLKAANLTGATMEIIGSLPQNDDFPSDHLGLVLSLPGL